MNTSALDGVHNQQHERIRIDRGYKTVKYKVRCMIN